MLDSALLDWGRSPYMPDVVASGAMGAPWLLVGLAAMAGTLAAWLTVVLLIYPTRERGIPGLFPLQGLAAAHASAFAAFVDRQLLVALPPPRRFFEQLGPDRFRREFGKTLQARLDEHVDDVMSRRNDAWWASLSAYARNRVYLHMHRRLPFAIDNFVDQLQRELDDVVSPALLVHRHLTEQPEVISRLVLASFGRDLIGLLPLAGLVAAGVGACVAFAFAGAGAWTLPLTLAGAALAGSSVLLLALGWPESRGGVWPLRTQGILYRRRRRFLRALARSTANDALAWRALVGETLHGAHSARVRHIMRREVSAILDAPLFKASLQLVLRPEGLVEVKASALEKAMEVMSSTPVSGALREACRQEIERTLEHAAGESGEAEYVALWRGILARAWKFLPLALALCGLAVGWLATTLLSYV